MFIKLVIFLKMGKMVLVPCKSYGKHKQLQYNFLINCRYLNFVKKLADQENSQVRT
jgi:hypothetical protein